MEYKLNKIDTELRKRIEDTTKEGLIHRKKEIIIKKDGHKREKDKSEDFRNSLKRYSKEKKDNKKFFIEALKVENVKVEAFIEEKDKQNTSTGRFLDIKR
ncbi:hypothetical protein [Clostridium rectalis]|uniref:hypothetical protein n=1 Tax=Clostridium rectalis TaxID=2040295 RepID=UPI000F640005|nr:hypothetical protein [Clostridium rectalis]